jgi:hypothetical protein
MNATYKCPRACLIGKSCLICKTLTPLDPDTIFLFKCPFLKTEIPLTARDSLVAATPTKYAVKTVMQRDN